MQMLYTCFMFAVYRPNAVCMQWTGAEVAIADHACMSVYLTVNDVCGCKNKPIGIVIGGKYMVKRKLGLFGIWRTPRLALCHGI